MMSKGGAEGYLFVGTRVIPAEGRITARGRAKRGKSKKVESMDDRVEGTLIGDFVDVQAGEVRDREIKRVKVEGVNEG